ncbi:MAG: type II toxin-antitoxin system VapC family toxin [Holophaga sp.]|jgi:PIN domain nuclease of toxin-antitoxin system
MPTHILDASAVIALLNREPGEDRVRALVRTGNAGISTVNISEVATKLVARGARAAEAELQCRSMGLDLVDADAEIAFQAAALLPATQSLGLSLGDRICLATAMRCGVPAVTADRAWNGIQGVPIEVIR